MNLFIRFIYRVTDWLGVVACLLLISLVALISFNVLARYAFNASSIGLEELAWHFYALIFLFGIPYAMRHGAHVRVDVIYERFSNQWQNWVDLLGTALFLIPFAAIVVWSGWHFTLAAYQLGAQPTSLEEFFTMLVGSGIGEQSQDPGGLLNRWLIKGAIPFSFLVLLLTAIAILFEKLQIVIAGSDQ